MMLNLSEMPSHIGKSMAQGVREDLATKADFVAQLSAWLAGDDKAQKYVDHAITVHETLSNQLQSTHEEYAMVLADLRYRLTHFLAAADAIHSRIPQVKALRKSISGQIDEKAYNKMLRQMSSHVLIERLNLLTTEPYQHVVDRSLDAGLESLDQMIKQPAAQEAKADNLPPLPAYKIAVLNTLVNADKCDKRTIQEAFRYVQNLINLHIAIGKLIGTHPNNVQLQHAFVAQQQEATVILGVVKQTALGGDILFESLHKVMKPSNKTIAVQFDMEIRRWQDEAQRGRLKNALEFQKNPDVSLHQMLRIAQGKEVQRLTKLAQEVQPD